MTRKTWSRPTLTELELERRAAFTSGPLSDGGGGYSIVS